jgi:hypothetical protein
LQINFFYDLYLIPLYSFLSLSYILLTRLRDFTSLKGSFSFPFFGYCFTLTGVLLGYCTFEDIHILHRSLLFYFYLNSLLTPYLISVPFISPDTYPLFNRFLFSSSPLSCLNFTVPHTLLVHPNVIFSNSLERFQSYVFAFSRRNLKPPLFPLESTGKQIFFFWCLQ